MCSSLAHPGSSLPSLLCSLRGKAGGAVAHAAAGADAGVSRTLLWWAWSGGASELQRQLIIPPAANPKASLGARISAALAGLQRRRTATDANAEPAEEALQQPAQAPVPVLDGLMATLLDEAALRGDPALAPYWRSRHGLRGDCATLINGSRPLLEVHAYANALGLGGWIHCTTAARFWCCLSAVLLPSADAYLILRLCPGSLGWGVPVCSSPSLPKMHRSLTPVRSPCRPPSAASCCAMWAPSATWRTAWTPWQHCRR